MTTKQINKLIKALEAKAEFHRTNQNDPYNVGTAAYLILSEVLAALKEATK